MTRPYIERIRKVFDDVQANLPQTEEGLRLTVELDILYEDLSEIRDEELNRIKAIQRKRKEVK